MNTTRVRDLLGLAAVAAIATWMIVRVAYGSLPPISIFAGSSLYAVAVLEIIAAFVVRGRVRNRQIGDGSGQLHPITAARALSLAKASALLGAAVVGVWTGFLFYIVPQRAVLRAAADDTAGAVVGLIAGIVLVVAALWLEHCCRTPDDHSEGAEL